MDLSFVTFYTQLCSARNYTNDGGWSIVAILMRRRYNKRVRQDPCARVTMCFVTAVNLGHMLGISAAELAAVGKNAADVSAGL
jgi:hypothetical protein